MKKSVERIDKINQRPTSSKPNWRTKTSALNHIIFKCLNKYTHLIKSNSLKQQN